METFKYFTQKLISFLWTCSQKWMKSNRNLPKWPDRFYLIFGVEVNVNSISLHWSQTHLMGSLERNILVVLVYHCAEEVKSQGKNRQQKNQINWTNHNIYVNPSLIVGKCTASWSLSSHLNISSNLLPMAPISPSGSQIITQTLLRVFSTMQYTTHYPCNMIHNTHVDFYLYVAWSLASVLFLLLRSSVQSYLMLKWN